MGTSPLLHIGYHKTGSTWLQKRIYRAENGFGFTIMWPRDVIIDAFVDVNPFSFDPESARAIFAEFMNDAAAQNLVPVISHERLGGLPLLGGVDAKYLAERLHATYPDSKVLLIFREQRGMMLSVYKQYAKRTGTDTVKKLWRQRTRRERSVPNPSLEVFEYHHLIRFYQSLFGADRFLALPFELLKKDSVAFVGDICKFVGLPAPTAVSNERDNVAIPGALIPVLRFVNKVQRALGLNDALGGPIADNRIRQRRMRTVKRIGAKVPEKLSRPFERRLKAAVSEVADGRFAESNRITSGLIGIDLGTLGYDMPAPSTVATGATGLTGA